MKLGNQTPHHSLLATAFGDPAFEVPELGVLVIKYENFLILEINKKLQENIRKRVLAREGRVQLSSYGPAIKFTSTVLTTLSGLLKLKK